MNQRHPKLNTRRDIHDRDTTTEWEFLYTLCLRSTLNVFYE